MGFNLPDLATMWNFIKGLVEVLVDNVYGLVIINLLGYLFKKCNQICKTHTRPC